MELLNMDLSKISSLPRSQQEQLIALMTPKMTKYIPHAPTPKQIAALIAAQRELFYGGAAGGGKLLSLGTPIFTNSGWKTVGTLVETDQVIALDGTWSDIEYITPAKMSDICYDITFSNGEHIQADGEHLWTVDRKKIVNRQHRKYLEVERVTWTTQQIVDDGIYYKANSTMQKRFMLPQHSGHDGIPQELSIHPYLLGYWLGDGNSSIGRLTINNEEFPFIQSFIIACGDEVGTSTEMQGCQSVQVKNLTSRLRQADLLHNKHIPLEYKLATREQRLFLLKGLMDSDGHCQPRGRCEWSQKVGRQELFDDVCELIASLGYKYSTSVAPTSFNGKSFPSNRVTFTPREHVAMLPHKTESMFDDALKNADSAIYIEEITQIPSVPMKCIRIKNETHVFLVGKTFLPTHNSDWLLMCGLQYVDVKGYAGIIFRKSYADLVKPGALIDRAKEWLAPFDDVKWVDKDKKFEFFVKYGKHTDVVSILQFGYLETQNDRFNYQGGEYQFIGFDELTHIDEVCYTYLFSRLRRLKHAQIPLRVRGASNPPDDDGGEWVYTRFVNKETKKPTCIFIPAGLDDNPYLDKEEYELSLDELDPVTKQRLRDGNWEVQRKGNMFKRDWFEIVDMLPPTESRRYVRFWDMASTEIKPNDSRTKKKKADWTASCKMFEYQGNYYIEDISRDQKKPGDTEELQYNTAVTDGKRVKIFEEQEPGSSGVGVIDNKDRTLLRNFNYEGKRSTGNKVLRASPMSAAASKGRIKIVRGCRNLDAFFNEAESFPGVHDDMVDAASGAFDILRNLPPTGIPLDVSGDRSHWALSGGGAGLLPNLSQPGCYWTGI